MEIDNHIAPNSRRLLAYLIDILPITFLLGLILYLTTDLGEVLSRYLNRGNDIGPRIEFLEYRNKIRNAAFLIWVIYCTILEVTRHQGTLGKKLMNIKVVDIDGQPLSTRISIRRNGLKLLSYFAIFLGFIWILFDKKKQGWHDKLTNTYVVNDDFEPNDFYTVDSDFFD